jgi:AAA+ ATPase superfamily predicted ATPase
MSKRFINRDRELAFLNAEYNKNSSSLVIIYGRRRIGKTALIKNFIQNKPALYFLASEELESQNISALKNLMMEFTGNPLMEKDFNFTWDDLFEVFKDFNKNERKILVIDEFQYLGKNNKSFPSIFQRVWDNLLENENIMVILCGSLISMMESQTLNYSSPLYGRRTGQIKMKQIKFTDYSDFFEDKSEEELIEFYAVTGGVPKYIEVFQSTDNIFAAIEKNVLNKQGFLYEEPIFLLEREVGEIGSYFSIISAIARGNHKLSKIATVLGVSQTNLTRYLKTLIDLDLIERSVPVTESDPSKSKQGLYYIIDNYIQFWFKFIYPYRSYIEMDDTAFVMDKIKQNLIDNHVSFVFENVCLQKMWQLSKQNELPLKFTRVGRWWDKNTEIDMVGLNEDTKEIILGECKYTNEKPGLDLFYQLMQKGREIPWNKNDRKEYYILFSKSGFTPELSNLAKERKDLKLNSLTSVRIDF